MSGPRLVEGWTGGPVAQASPSAAPRPPSGRWWLGEGISLYLSAGRQVCRHRGLQPLVPSPRALLATLPLKPGRAALVWGEPLRPLAAAAAAWGVARRMQVLVVDAANRFDPYLLVREARRRGLHPRQALDRVQVARAFTSHQLVRLLQEELAASLPPGSLVVVLGPVSLFYDEQVPLAERHRLFREVVDTLAAIKVRSPLLLLQPYLPRGATNRHFGKMLAPMMDSLVEAGFWGRGTARHARLQNGRSG